MYRCASFGSNSSRMYTFCSSTEDDDVGDGIKEVTWFDSKECDTTPTGGSKYVVTNRC